MSILTQAYNGLRSTVRPAVKWAAEARAARVAGRLAYAPKVGLAGAGAGAVLGGAMSSRDSYGNGSRTGGALRGAAVGALAGFRLGPRGGMGAMKALGAGPRPPMLSSGRSPLMLGAGTKRSGWANGIRDYARAWGQDKF